MVNKKFDKYLHILSLMNKKERQLITDRAIEILQDNDVDLGYPSLSYKDIVADMFFNTGVGSFKEFDEITTKDIKLRFPNRTPNKYFKL